MMRTKEKNSLMRIAGAISTLVLVTMVVLGSTFAKYITEATATDGARVAKWGIAVDETNFVDLFTTSYTSAQGTTVNSNNGDNVIAPGTTGSLQFEITGTPEVAYKLSVDVSSAYTGAWGGWGVTPPFNGPLEFFYSMNGGAPVGPYSLNQITTEIETALNNSGVILPGNPANTDFGITWVWPFDGPAPAGRDEMDTEVGNMTTAPGVTFEFDVTVVQVD
jgi:hypothetical protein